MRLSLRFSLVPVMCAAAVSVRAQAAPFSPNETSTIGKAIISAEISRYGRVSNVVWDKEISGILSKIERASGYPGMEIKYVVVNDSSVNASAIPGGYIVVNAGLISLLDTLTRISTHGVSAHRALLTADLAAVLSHELAHITLGHTDTLAARVARMARLRGVAATAGDSDAAFLQAARDSAPTLEDLRQSRERELEADKVGALYLLRAGWTIQTAVDLMLVFDSLERKDPTFYQTITYVRTHPRASTREAELEIFRARLKLLQADYDDALALISNNVAQPTAITLLDTLLAYFPRMVPALHARGTAYHQLWLETVPVPSQQVRASLTTYSFRFLPMVRGAPGDMKLFAAASEDYKAAIALDPLSKTMAQQAMLYAYAGDCSAADHRSQQAVLADSVSPVIVNDRGVSLYLCGNQTAALSAFQKAARLLRSPSPTFLFNVARTMKAVGDPSADARLREYLIVDDSSEWSAEARKLLGGAFASSAGTSATRIRDAGPPAQQGITLGSSLATVRAKWGEPTTVTGDSVIVLTYRSLGTRVAVSSTSGVGLIILLTRDAGAVDGVRVGDQATAARARWGSPTERHDDYDVYSRGSWFAIVASVDGVVSSLAIGRNE